MKRARLYDWLSQAAWIAIVVAVILTTKHTILMYKAEKGVQVRQVPTINIPMGGAQ